MHAPSAIGLKKSPPGVTRVVCAGRVPSDRKATMLKRRLRRTIRAGASQPKIRRLRQRVAGARRKFNGAVKRNPSIKAVQRSLDNTRRAGGYKVRPSQPRIVMRRKQRLDLLSINKRFLKLCKTNSVQKAVTQSKNNDRIVVMPGRYTEPRSRDAATNDPKCNPRLLQKDASGDDTPSYAYQATCPNDQNLIYLQGRAFGPNPAPQPPRSDRRGVPDEGPCLRCNIQVDGTRE